MAEKKHLNGMNAERAGWAKTAILAFCGETRQTLESDGFVEVAGDLVADIMHMADAEGVPFEDILRKAADHYNYEIQCRCRLCGTRFDAEADGTRHVTVCLECQ